MKIERDAMQKSYSTALKELRKSCLDCPNCSGACWQFIEMQQLPDTVLKSAYL